MEEKRATALNDLRHTCDRNHVFLSFLLFCSLSLSFLNPSDGLDLDMSGEIWFAHSHRNLAPPSSWVQFAPELIPHTAYCM